MTDPDALHAFHTWADQIQPEKIVDDDIAALQEVGVAANALDDARSKLQSAVDSAREVGFSWARIGTVLGVSRQAAEQRFGRGRTSPTSTPDDPLRSRESA